MIRYPLKSGLSFIFVFMSVRLRTLLESDAAAIARLLNNKKIWDNLRDFIPLPYSIIDAQIFIKQCGEDQPQKHFAIEYKNELVGVIGFIPQDDIYRKNAELGYWLGEPYWNKGIMTQAITLAVDYAFAELNIVRIFAHVFDRNIPSQKVLAKAGFNLDYIAKKAVIKNGIILDEYRFSIVKD